jgi:ABC-type glycerol-3-phosphate transport system substrate-binding protein
MHPFLSLKTFLRNPIKINKKTVMIIISIAVCFILLIGCSNEALVEPKDYIFRFTEFNAKNENYDLLVDVAFDSNAVYMLTDKTEVEENGVSENFYLIKTDLSGNVLEKQLLSSVIKDQTENNSYTIYMSMGIGINGQVYLVRQTVRNFKNLDGISEPIAETAIVLRETDTETVLIDVSGMLSPLGIDTSSMYFDSFEVDQNGYAYLMANKSSVWAFDLTTGAIVFNNKPIPQGGNIRELLKNADGEICVVASGTSQENSDLSENLIIVPINPKTDDYGKKESINISTGKNSNVGQGDDRFTYFIYNSSSIYGYSGETHSLVADLTSSGVNLYDITRVIAVSETQFLLTGYTADAVGFDRLFMLSKVDPSNVPDKAFITVAAITEPLYLDGYIKEFMLTHPQYQVELKLYAGDDNTSYEQALDALNTDIIAGKVPDVLVIDNVGIPYSNYVRKGVLTDLYPLIDEDPDLSREDFLKPFLKAVETDGKLYSIAPAFDIATLVGKTSVFGEKQGQSLEELQTAAAAADFSGATLFGPEINRNVFVSRILSRTSSNFIDDEKGICSFDSPEFVSLLEFAKSLPAVSSNPEPYLPFVLPGETDVYSKGNALIEFAVIFDFRHIVALEKTDFNAPITFLGYPGTSGGNSLFTFLGFSGASEGSGIYANTHLETAIPVNAKNPDGAWEFVKGLQSYGDAFWEGYGYPPLIYFPTLISELENAAENAAIPPFQYGNGERVSREFWFGRNLSNQPDNTEADNAKMFALFDSIEGIYRENPAIMNIISEETEVFFVGNKSAKETAEIIQNRATTYLEETK